MIPACSHTIVRRVYAISRIAEDCVPESRLCEASQDSNQWVVHTQEGLTAIETVLSTLVDAEATRGDLASARAPELLDRAERTIDIDVTRLATLTRDNPTQQANVQQLRQDATRTLAALRAQSDAKRGARAASPADAEPNAPAWMPCGRRCER